MDTTGTGPYVLPVLRAGWEGNLGYGTTFGALLRMGILVLLACIAKTIGRSCLFSTGCVPKVRAKHLYVGLIWSLPGLYFVSQVFC